MALAAYRHVLRAVRIAFQGDHRLLISARNQARSSFALYTSLLPSSPEAAAQIAHAEDVARILRENVVQGLRADGEGDKYKLRIHEETERGDNDSVKMAEKGVGFNLGGCCGNK